MDIKKSVRTAWGHLQPQSRGANDCLRDNQLAALRKQALTSKIESTDIEEEVAATIGLGQKIRSRNIYIPNAAARIKFILDCLTCAKPHLILARDERLRFQIELYRQSGLISRTLAKISSGSPVALVLSALGLSLILWAMVMLAVRYLVDHFGASLVSDVFFMSGRALAVIASAAFIGGVVSIATRLQEFSRVRDLDPFAMFWTALLKPLIGVILSLFIFATLVSGLVKFGFLDDKDFVTLLTDPKAAVPNKMLYTLWVIGFISGFSERFAWDFVSRAQGALNGSAKSEPKKG